MSARRQRNATFQRKLALRGERSPHGWANQSKRVFDSQGRICAATKRKLKIAAEKHSASCGEAHERKIVGRALKRSGEIDGMASWWCKDRSRGSDDMNDVGLRQQ